MMTATEIISIKHSLNLASLLLSERIKYKIRIMREIALFCFALTQKCIFLITSDLFKGKIRLILRMFVNSP